MKIEITVIRDENGDIIELDTNVLNDINQIK